MTMIEKFKENKKVMEIKMEQAAKLADDAANEFIETIEPLVKDASEEEIKAFVEADDDDIEFEDKMAVLAAFAEAHGKSAGFMVLGMHI